MGSHLSAAVAMQVNRAPALPTAPADPTKRHLKVMGQRMPIEMRNPVDGKYGDYARANLELQKALGIPMCLTKTVALCGAGPSLKRAKIKGADEVWAFNSALPWMTKNGLRVDVGVGMDQTPGLLREWSDPPEVRYYVATTCDPELVRHLKAHGREVLFFHNAVGFDGEMEHYQEWPPSVITGHGNTVAVRSVWLAEWMGFHRIDFYGVDCAFDGDVVHANGEDYRAAYGNPVLLEAVIDGKHWKTRPDMLMEAVNMVRLARTKSGLVRFQEGTLPAALFDKDDAFLDTVARRLAPGEVPEDLPDSPEPGA